LAGAEEFSFPLEGIENQRLTVLNKLRDRKISVVTEGVILLQNKQVKVKSVLHDTGASDHNYISPELFESVLPFLFSEKLRKVRGAVTLGDGSTKLPISTEVKLVVQFWDSSGMSHQAEVWFQVFKSGHDMIIGYPAIVDHFLDLMMSMLRQGREERVTSGKNLHFVDSFSLLVDLDSEAKKPADLIPAWSTSMEPAEEEEGIYEPLQFGEPLHFLTISSEEAESEFCALLDTHISPEFAAAQPVRQLLLKKHYKCWVPDNWEGIKGIDPIELRWNEERLNGYRSVVKSRHINPRLLESATAEFQRLRKYHFVPSQSAIAAPLVIAPKATAPYIRFCGDYVKTNSFIETHHGFIPVVEYELHKIKGFTYFLDIDMTNAFHQMKLAEKTSERLSVVTPWGQFRPLFMPEGVAPASILLQDVMRSIFSDFSEWAVIIFDNILLLAHDFPDAYTKLDTFLTRCAERNIVLKMSKSYLGFQEVKFFGYIVRKDSFELGEERKTAIARIPFPRSVKEMQSFLGLCIFFQRFVPHYASKVAQLYDMTKQNFNWEVTSWKVDYHTVFKDAKQAIIDSMKLYFLDYHVFYTGG